MAGAGPAGLALALQAHDHGAVVRVVDRRPEAVRPSRALIFHARTLEVLRPLGVTRALLGGARHRASGGPAARLPRSSRSRSAASRCAPGPGGADRRRTARRATTASAAPVQASISRVGSPSVSTSSTPGGTRPRRLVTTAGPAASSRRNSLPTPITTTTTPAPPLCVAPSPPPLSDGWDLWHPPRRVLDPFPAGPAPGRRWVHERELPPFISRPGRRCGRAIRCHRSARTGGQPGRPGVLLRGPGGGPGRHAAHSWSAPRDRAAAVRSPLPPLAGRPFGRARQRARTGRELCRSLGLVPRRSRPARAGPRRRGLATARLYAAQAREETIAGDEGPLPGMPSSLAAISGVVQHLSWEKNSFIQAGG